MQAPGDLVLESGTSRLHTSQMLGQVGMVSTCGGGVVVIGAWFDEEGVVLSRECEKFEVCEEVDVVVGCVFLVVREV